MASRRQHSIVIGALVGTGLLFVRGAEEDIEIAVRTVRTYTGSGDRGN